MALLQEQAQDSNADSLSHRLRARRFEAFEAAVAHLDNPRVLDVGGTSEFWEQRGWADRDDVEIVTLNITAEQPRFENVIPVVGDATNMPFKTDAFDVVFSNSVIEHLFHQHGQKRMAEEVRRVGKTYWVQTPNFWFPMEPHFLVPGWQWLPAELRIAVLQRRSVGQMGQCPDRDEAERHVREIRLLTRWGMSKLFPEARIVPERFAGLVKSWTAVSGL